MSATLIVNVHVDINIIYQSFSVKSFYARVCNRVCVCDIIINVPICLYADSVDRCSVSVWSVFKSRLTKAQFHCRFINV